MLIVFSQPFRRMRQAVEPSMPRSLVHLRSGMGPGVTVMFGAFERSGFCSTPLVLGAVGRHTTSYNLPH